ncbi:LADA_0H01464g1_1 [Lachancea dasiensis]|uniref:LADA_0H01464g1_1 n=1 Tax=Lachancea dasiensis TaxID=1072105 RepID=A0A1G4JZ79_9SACH|nr:LADA_0H01464g1_1 [Lachancea dasiensis]
MAGRRTILLSQRYSTDRTTDNPAITALQGHRSNAPQEHRSNAPTVTCCQRHHSRTQPGYAWQRLAMPMCSVYPPLCPASVPSTTTPIFRFFCLPHAAKPFHVHSMQVSLHQEFSTFFSALGQGRAGPRWAHLVPLRRWTVASASAQKSVV